jgi:putative transposase
MSDRDAFMKRHRSHWEVPVLYDVLEGSPNGYHQRRQRTAHVKPHRGRVSNDALARGRLATEHGFLAEL